MSTAGTAGTATAGETGVQRPSEPEGVNRVAAPVPAAAHQLGLVEPATLPHDLDPALPSLLHGGPVLAKRRPERLPGLTPQFGHHAIGLQTPISISNKHGHDVRHGTHGEREVVYIFFSDNNMRNGQK